MVALELFGVPGSKDNEGVKVDEDGDTHGALGHDVLVQEIAVMAL